MTVETDGWISGWNPNLPEEHVRLDQRAAASTVCGRRGCRRRKLDVEPFWRPTGRTRSKVVVRCSCGWTTEL